MPEPQPPETAETLHLFTSTIRELYIADTVDLLAAPKGAMYRFRYDGKYLHDGTRTRWKAGELTGYPVVVHFSLQHPADFYRAVFIPLRSGEIVTTLVEGDTYVANFRLGKYLPLHDEPQWIPKERRKPVLEYTDAIKELLGPGRCPDDGINATLGPIASNLVSPSGDAGKDFATIVRFMTAVLSFSPRVYWRIASINKGDEKEPVNLDQYGNLGLTAGQVYTMNIAHYQQEPLSAEVTVSVNTPKAIELVGGAELVLRSKYDVMTIRLFPPSRDDNVICELAITTDLPAKGPTVRLPVVIKPPATQAASGVLLGTGGGLALALPAVFASTLYLPLRASLAAFGALLVGLALFFRRHRGLPG